MGDLNGAIKSFKRAVSIDPFNTDAYLQLGLAQKEDEDFFGALESFFKVTDLNPRDASAYTNMSIVLREKGDLDGAMNYIQKALLIMESDALAHYNKATILQLKGAMEASKTSFSHGFQSSNSKHSSPINRKVTALLCVGRSGSLFVHSLFDGHPEVSTLPEIYFSGWFGHKTWELFHPEFSDVNWRETLAENLIKVYEPMFNAASKKNVPGKPMGNNAWLARASGFTELGEDRSTSLQLDTNRF